MDNFPEIYVIWPDPVNLSFKVFFLTLWPWAYYIEWKLIQKKCRLWRFQSKRSKFVNFVMKPGELMQAEGGMIIIMRNEGKKRQLLSHLSSIKSWKKYLICFTCVYVGSCLVLWCDCIKLIISKKIFVSKFCIEGFSQ